MDSLTVTLQQEVLLDGLMRSGAALAHDCGGKLACAACCVVVREGAEALSEPTDDELEMLERAGVSEVGARLACQAIGSGEVVVEIRRGEVPEHRSMAPVSLTPQAARFLAAQLAKIPNATGIRLRVVLAGCSGRRYSVAPVEAEAVQEGDAVFRCSGVRVVVDPDSLPFVQGTTVRFAQEGLARRLRFDNPNARQNCGCGESFGT